MKNIILQPLATVDVGLHVQYTVTEEHWQWSSGSSSAIEGLGRRVKVDDGSSSTVRRDYYDEIACALSTPFSSSSFLQTSFLPFSYFDFVVATIVGGFGLLLCCSRPVTLHHARSLESSRVEPQKSSIVDSALAAAAAAAAPNFRLNATKRKRKPVSATILQL